MMVFLGGLHGRHWCSGSLRRLVFFFHLSFWIVGFHVLDFLWREMRQMADEQDQLPAFIILIQVRLAPRRHSGQRDAVANDVIEFAIARSEEHTSELQSQ